MKKIKKILCVLVAICLLVEPTPRSLSAEQTAVPNDPVDLLSIQSGRYSPGEISRVEMMTERKESLRSSKSKVSASFYEPQFSEERVIVKLASRTGMRSYGAVPDLGIEYEGIRMLNPSVRGQKARAFSVNEDKNDVFVLTLKNPGKDAVEQALETLNSNPNVEIAEPDYYRTVNTEKKEETKEREGSEEEDEEEDEEGEESLDIFAPELIDAIKAWEITSGSKDVVVGVIDTGIDGDHPELEDNLWVNPNPNKNGYANDVHGYDFVDKTGGTPTDLAGHGTHVAGIIGAGGAGDSGFQGISPNVSLAWLGVGMGDSDMISDSACIEALNYADNCGIPITNNSYGGAEYSTIFEEAIRNYDGLFVAAAGNEEMNNDEVPNYPANFDCPNIISVTSTDRNDNLSWFSNYGENTVHIAAPGEEILSTYPDEMAGEDSPGELYAKMSGTSMAAPHVAGAAALVLAQNPKYSSEDVRAAILGGANHLVGLLGMVENCRRLDAYRALAPRPSIDRLTVSAESD
ncbi:MAG: S8 family serine peptidase, partial [Lachnoclostridium sp.]|nr:S8 family serine peptidase [Lachnoclostridium sp.]